jgi:hypothetical protein
MKINTKAEDLLKAYNKSINELLVEILLRSDYKDIVFGFHDGKQLLDCKAAEGTNFLAGGDGELITGEWLHNNIGETLIINDEYWVTTEALKQAVELKVANIEDIFDYYDYVYDAEEKRKKVLNFKNWYKLK